MHSDDETIQNATMIRKWQEQLHVAGEIIGRTFNVACNLRHWLTEIGFINVEEVINKGSEYALDFWYMPYLTLCRSQDHLGLET